MSFRKALGTDKQKENEGVWYTVYKSEDDKEVRFLIKSTGTANVKYLREIQRLMKPYRKMGNNLPATLSLKINRDAYANTCILNWENVPNEDETENLEFSVENARLLLEQMPNVYEILAEASNDITLFNDANVEDDAKNSQNFSSVKIA